jgi:hypothetical protein
MHFARILPLLLLATCSRAPDMATCKLVGTWQPTLNYFEVKKLRESPEWLDYCSKYPGMDHEDVYVREYSITFGADGTWSIPVSKSQSVGWKPLRESVESITIELTDRNGGRAREATYTFASADEMTDDSVLGTGHRYTRVKPTRSRSAPQQQELSDQPVGDFPTGTTPLVTPKK